MKSITTKAQSSRAKDAKVDFAISAFKKKLPILRINFILLIFFNSSFLVHSQDLKLSEVIINIAEELAEDETDPDALTLFIERMNDLAEDPVAINSNDHSELSRLFFLSDFQIKALADYTRSSGKILSPFEIATIPGFDRETASLMIPFITLETRSDSLSDSAHFRSTFLINSSIKSSDNDTATPGSPVKILTKYQFTSGHISGGFTAEKDQGEKLLSGNPSLPDFFSGHLSYSGKGFIRRIVIGDYAARFGQGTNINTGLRTGLSLTAPGNMSGRDEIKPYTSTGENNFFRGMATQFQIKNLTFSAFYSKNKTDGTLNSSDGIFTDIIETLNTTGLHNTYSALARKDNITENSYGGNISYSFNNLKIGLIWAENKLSLPLYRQSINPEELYDFEGSANSTGTLYYSGLIRKMILFGEISSDNKSKIALVQGVTVRLDDRLTINILYRRYDPGYTAFHGNGQGSSSSGDNLHGLLGSFTFEASRYLFISAGWDNQQFPWMKYRCSGPSLAKKGEVRIKYLPSDNFKAEAVYSVRYSMYDEKESSGIAKQDYLITREIKTSVKYSPVEGLTFGTRVDLKFAEPSNEKGMLLLQDVNYRFRSVPLSLWFRYCIFNTDSWDTRLYTWENDLLYSFSIPALSGEGSRSYLVAGWKIWDNAELRVKYGITSLTANDKIIRDIQELKMQFRVRF